MTVRRLCFLLWLFSAGAHAQPGAPLRQTQPQPRTEPQTLTCTTDQAPPEYTPDDLHGPRTAFDLELCRAVAVAVAGENAKVLLVPVPDEVSAVQALVAGKAELIPTISLDLSHATMPELTLGPPVLLDGTALLVPAATASVEALSGRKICFLAETETETGLRTYFRLHGLDLLPYPFSEEGEMQAALTSGNCAAIAADRTRLTATLPQVGAHYRILPETLAPDPLASATRASDAGFARLVAWVCELLLHADALGVTRADLPRLAHSTDPAIQRLLGRTHELGRALGLDDDWPMRVLRVVGSYRELLSQTLPGVRLESPALLPLK